MFCNKCGKEIPNDSKVCKFCGNVVNQQQTVNCNINTNNTVRSKKKIYQQWWFWLIIVFLIIGIVGMGMSNDNENTTVGTNTIKEEKKETYKVGETYTSKYIKIKYLSVKDYTSNNQFIQPDKGNKYIRLEFEFENISKNDQGVYSSFFKCYADGYDMDSKWLDNYLSSTTLSPEKKTKGYIYFEVPKDAKEIIVEYEDNIWTSNKVKFIVK